MCFRPPSAEAGKKCPKCGASNPAPAKACSAYGAELPAGPSVPQVPGVPGAPKARGVPGVPSAPGAPGPKPPAPKN